MQPVHEISNQEVMTMCISQIFGILWEFFKVAAMPIAIAMIAWFFTRRFYMNQRTQEFWNRLQDINKLVLQYPEFQEFISLQATQKNNYFTDKNMREDERFFRKKAMVYLWLNLFNEVIKTAEGKEFAWLGKKKFKEICGYETWEDYIIRKMRNPRFKEAYAEGIWDKEFKDFVGKHKDSLKEPAEPLLF